MNRLLEPVVRGGAREALRFGARSLSYDAPPRNAIGELLERELAAPS